MAIEKLKGHKSPGINQIQADLIRQWVEQLAQRSINLLILSRIRRNYLRRSGRSLIILHTYKKDDNTD
jgi:hypothetical protein